MQVNGVPRALLFDGAKERAKGWTQFLRTLVLKANRAPFRMGSQVRLTGQAAALTATALPTGTLDHTGVYRVSYHARVTQAATTSSSLTVTVGYTDGGVAVTRASAALTGNTTASATGADVVVRADTNTTLTYATSYSSSGGTPMQYALDVSVEVLR